MDQKDRSKKTVVENQDGHDSHDHQHHEEVEKKK